MSLIALVAALVSVIAYLALGLGLGRRTKTLADHIPIAPGHLAHIAGPGEFSGTTVAATISLATVVLAFFELAPYMGLWLAWTVLTTALGLVVVRLAAGRIWSRLAAYGDHRPTLHEFLGTEFGAAPVALVGAVCTSLGFLGAFAVELTVGSRFLANLVPAVPPFVFVVALAAVSLAYTSAGGFRAVVVTDLLQMKAIWLLLIALSLFYGYYISANGGLEVNLAKVPPEMRDLSWRDGLGSFLVGIFVINVPTFLADMGIWQRMAGAQDAPVVTRGLWRSVAGSMATWALFVVIACLAPMIAVAVPDENPLLTLLHAIGSMGVIGAVVFFCVVLGLYGAMFSTASTQLMAVAHTIFLDIIERRRSTERSDTTAARDIRASRFIIVCSALAAMVVVEALTAAGFTIADLVFAVYGAQLGLFPPTLLALSFRRERLRPLAPWMIAAIAFGFVAGWGSAAYGKAAGDANLVFLAPAISLTVSGVIAIIAYLVTAGKKVPAPARAAEKNAEDR